MGRGGEVLEVVDVVAVVGPRAELVALETVRALVLASGNVGRVSIEPCKGEDEIRGERTRPSASDRENLFSQSSHWWPEVILTLCTESK